MKEKKYFREKTSRIALIKYIALIVIVYLFLGLIVTLIFLFLLSPVYKMYGINDAIAITSLIGYSVSLAILIYWYKKIKTKT